MNAKFIGWFIYLLVGSFIYLFIYLFLLSLNRFDRFEQDVPSVQFSPVDSIPP